MSAVAAVLSADGSELSLSNIASAAAPAGSTFTVKGYAALAAGGLAVLRAWDSASADGLTVALYDRDGVLKASADVGSLPTLADAEVFALAGGGFVVAWDGGAGSAAKAQYRVYDASGALRASGSAGSAGAAGVAGFALPDGGFQLQWTGTGATAAVFDALGAQTARTPLASPLVFAKGAGGAYLALQDNQLTWFDGTAAAPALSLPGEGAHTVTSAAIAALAGGDMAVAWTDAGGAFIAVYDTATHTLSPRTLIDAGAASAAAVAALPDGGFAVSWTQGGQLKGEAFGPAGELGPSLYLEGGVAGTTSAGDLVAVQAGAGGTVLEQHYALSHPAPPAPAAQYYDASGHLMPQSAGPLDDITHSLHGPAAGGATLYAPIPAPAGVAASGGHNTIIASNGDNSYWLGATDTVVVPAGVTGTKTIYCWNAEVLPAGVNNLVFYGAGNWGIGNDLGNLIMMGGNDAAYMDGRAGDDVLVGGFGKNTFGVQAGNGSDTIYNFHTWQDGVRLDGFGFANFAQVKAAMTQVGADVVLRLDATETLTFRGVNLADFTARNFLLPLDMSLLGGVTFGDDFNDLQLLDPTDGSGHWRTNFGGNPNVVTTYAITSNQEKQVYTDASFKGTADHPLGYDPFSLDNGILTITAEKIAYGDSQYTFGQAYSSGMLNTKGLFMQKYGYFEMRAELPTSLGTWPAFWMAEDPFIPGTEADILEHLALQPNVSFARSNDNGYVQGASYWMPDPSGFHTYGMLWTPTNVTFYVDRIAILQVPAPTSWDQPMYMILNMALGGWGGAIDQNGLPADMKVDYVRAYGLADGSQVVRDMTTDNGFVSISTPTYTAPAGVTTITLAGSRQTVTGNDAGDTFNSNDTGNVLIGGAGADTFRLGRGGDQATGKGGADTYIQSEAPWTPGRVTDFAPAEDRFDLSPLMARIGYSGANPVADGRLKITADSTGSAQVWLDADGPATANGWLLVTTLAGAAPSALKLQGYVVVGATSAPPAGGAVSTSAASYTAPAGVTDITLTGSHQTVTGNNAGDTFHSNNTGNRLIGGTGADLFLLGRGGDVATGGTGADRFAFAETPWTGAHLTDFLSGTDRIDVTGLLAKAGYAGSNPVADGYLKVVDASGQAQVWSNLDHVSPGAGWWLVATLDGVASSALHLGDLVFAGGAVAGIGGAGGSTGGGTSGGGSSVSTSAATYVAPAGVTTITLTGSHQTVTGNDAGDTFVSNNTGNRLIGGAGADLFKVGRGGDVVTGAAGADRFAFAETPWTAAHITDFAGQDLIDLSGLLAKSGYTGSDPVGAGYLRLGADASGQAQVWSNLDHVSPGAGWWLVATLDGVSSGAVKVQGTTVAGSGSGGSGTGTSVSTSAATYVAPAGVTTITLTGSHQTVTGNDAGDTFVSNNTGNRLIGGAGADLFKIGRGGDVVTGKAGADTFAFAETPWTGAHITDFTPGQDRIDLTGLLAKSGYAGSDPIGAGYVRITADAGGAQVWSNLDHLSPGAGWWLAATVDGVASTSLHMQGAFITG